MSYHDIVLNVENNLLIRKMALKANRKLKKLGIAKEDCCLFGTGISGVMAVAKLSVYMGIQGGFVRKEEDRNNHGRSNGEAPINKAKYPIFCDDMIAEGWTMKRMHALYPIHSYILLSDRDSLKDPSDLGITAINLLG